MARHTILASTKMKIRICYRKNRTANHSKAKLQLSHSLTNRKPWWRFRKHRDALQTKVSRKRYWESYKNKQQQLKDAHKQSQGHRFIPQKVSFPLFSHCLAFLLKGFLTYLTRGECEGCEHFQELCFKPPKVISPQLTNCD